MRSREAAEPAAGGWRAPPAGVLLGGAQAWAPTPSPKLGNRRREKTGRRQRKNQ